VVAPSTLFAGSFMIYNTHTTFFLTGSSHDLRTSGMTVIKLVDLAQTSQWSCPSICAVVSVPKPLDRID